MHLFSPANPLTLIQSGLTWYIGRAGLCTQLSPIPVGFGTPSQNPSSNSVAPGFPNTGASGSGPYTPPYPVFPPANKPELTTFTILRAGGIVQVYSKGAPGGTPCSSTNYGTLTAGGGINGVVIECFTANSTASTGLQLFILQSASPSNPFTQSFFNSISWTVSPDNYTLDSSAATSFTTSATTGPGWIATWLWSSVGMPGAYVASTSYTFTVS
jgi:hypothetical protein